LVASWRERTLTDRLLGTSRVSVRAWPAGAKTAFDFSLDKDSDEDESDDDHSRSSEGGVRGGARSFPPQADAQGLTRAT